MAIMGVMIEDNKILNRFVIDMKKRLNNPDLFQNPFTGFIRLTKGEEPYLFIYLNLIWLNPFYPAVFLTFALLLSFSFKLNWIFLFLIPLWMGAFMFTNQFTKWAMYVSLRKYGYNGKIKFMNDRELLLRLAKWGKTK